MQPVLRSIMPGTTARQHRYALLRLVSMISSQRSSSLSAIEGPDPPWAALLTRMSMLPKAWVADAIRRSTSSRCVTSVGTASARRPKARISAAVSLSTSGLRPAMATSAPARANSRAMPLPIPVPPPVTTAVFPSSERLAVLAPMVIAPKAPSRISLRPTLSAASARHNRSGAMALRKAPKPVLDVRLDWRVLWGEVRKAGQVRRRHRLFV